MEEIIHVLVKSIPILVTGLNGAVYTSCARTRNARAAGHALLGAAVFMSVHLSKAIPKAIPRSDYAWYNDRHLATLAAVAVLVLLLGLLYRHLEDTYTVTLEEVVEQYCASLLGQEQCGALRDAIGPVVQNLKSEKDVQLHAWNRKELVQAMMIVAVAFLFISSIVYTKSSHVEVRFDDIKYSSSNILSVVGLSLWTGWILYAQSRLQTHMPLNMASKPGLDDMFNDANLYMRWIQCYLLLGFVFIVYSMTHARTRGSSAFLYAFLLSGLAVMGSVNKLYNASSQPTWIAMTAQANHLIHTDAKGGTPPPAAPDIQDDKRHTQTVGIVVLAVALVCVYANSATVGISTKQKNVIVLVIEFLVVFGILGGVYAGTVAEDMEPKNIPPQPSSR